MAKHDVLDILTIFGILKFGLLVGVICLSFGWAMIRACNIIFNNLRFLEHFETFKYI